MRDHHIYLSGGQRTGVLNFRNELFTTEELNPIRFYSFLEEHFNKPHIYIGGDEENVTEYQCFSDFADHEGLSSKVVFCMRGYKKYSGLYDSFMTVTSLVDTDQALHTTLVMAGTSKENALRFSQTFLEAITWKH